MKKKIAITLDEDILVKLSTLTIEEDRNISNQINKILKEHFKSKEKPAK